MRCTSLFAIRALVFVTVLFCCVSYFVSIVLCVMVYMFFFFQAEDGIRDLVRSRGLGDVYKRQLYIQNGCW